MIKIENDCVGCPPNMGCLGSACPYRNVAYWICDECENDVDEGELWEVDGKQICEDCLKSRFKRVEYTQEEYDDGPEYEPNDDFFYDDEE